MGNQDTFRFMAHGHTSIVSTHLTTLEITREPHLTTRGNCIVAVRAESGLLEVPPTIKRVLSTSTGRGRLTLLVQDESFSVEGKGSPGLRFAHPTEMVVRKSGYVSDRTLMIYCNNAAANVPRSIVKLLQDPDRDIIVEISVI